MRFVTQQDLIDHMASPGHEERLKAESRRTVPEQQQQQQQTIGQEIQMVNAHLLTPTLSSHHQGHAAAAAADDLQGQNPGLQGQIDNQQQQNGPQESNNSSELAALLNAYMDEAKTNGSMQ